MPGDVYWVVPGDGGLLHQVELEGVEEDLSQSQSIFLVSEFYLKGGTVNKTGFAHYVHTYFPSCIFRGWRKAVLVLNVWWQISHLLTGSPE